MTRVRDWIPDPETRAELNAAFAKDGTDTGFWDNHGRPAPWPDDIDQWRPSTSEPLNRQPRQQPF